MSNKLIKKRRLNTKNHRIYLKDRELKKTTFEIGNKVSYIINKKTKTLQIIPQVVPFKTGDITVCKCKQKENDILPLMDIRRKEVLNSFNNCDIVQVLIYEDRVVIKGIDTTVDKIKIEKVSMTYKELDNLYREILKDDYDLYKKNKDYISEVGNRKIINKMEQFTDKFLRAVSLFCGAGLLDTGFKQAGFKIDFAIDFNKAAIDTYKFNNGDYAVYADINNIDINTLPKVPVLIAGSPCQDFSNLNSKTGKVLDSPKNQLVRKVIDVAKANPELKVLVLENVPQLLTKGKVFVDELKERLSDFEVTINKVNSYDYGSPQVRRRAIIIASKIGKIKLVNPPNVKHQTVRDAFNGLTDDIPNQLDYTHSAKSTIEKMKYVPQGGNYKDIPPEIRSKGRYSNSYRRLDNNKPSVTIPHASRSVITHPTLNRIISIRECCRLFDLPDNYVIQGPLSEMYQIVGNGVPVKLAKGIAEQIKKAFVRFYWKAFNDFCLI